MDYEALKEQWSDIEERDGIRLSWNTFPSSRMVSARFLTAEQSTYCRLGSVAACCSYWRTIYPSERATEYTGFAI